jgi:hypothetical protein
MTTEAEDTYCPRLEDSCAREGGLQHWQVCLAAGWPCWPDRARHGEWLAGCAELEIKEPGICLNQNPVMPLPAKPPAFPGRCGSQIGTPAFERFCR